MIMKNQKLWKAKMMMRKAMKGLVKSRGLKVPMSPTATMTQVTNKEMTKPVMLKMIVKVLKTEIVTE